MGGIIAWFCCNLMVLILEFLLMEGIRRSFLFSIEVDQMNKMRKCDKLQSLVKHLLG